MSCIVHSSAENVRLTALRAGLVLAVIASVLAFVVRAAAS